MGIGKCAYRDHHDGLVAFLGVEHVAPTDRTKPETKLRSVISCPDKFRRIAGNLIRRGISGERCKNATGSLLTSKAMADTAT